MSHLLGPKRLRGDVRDFERKLGVSRGTVYLWLRARSRPSPRRVGRPGASEVQRFAALRAVVCLDRMGRTISGRSAKQALGARVTLRLARDAVARFKRLRARHQQRHRERAQVQVTVKRPDVIWGLDGSHVGRTVADEALESQTLRDHASRRTIGVAVGESASGEDLVLLLEHARSARGALPLVLLTDNASNNTSEEVESYLERHRVIHLLTRPYTPQHNAPTERAHRELKELAGLGKGVVLDGARDAAQRLACAWHSLDHHHARPVLNGRTAAECYQSERARYTMPARDLFYRTTRDAIDVASNQPTARARRRARREAIYASLESFGLVSRTRGGVPFRAVMCVGIS